eukprot:3066281-Pyramimonas_sp.AAC.1
MPDREKDEKDDAGEEEADRILDTIREFFASDSKFGARVNSFMEEPGPARGSPTSRLHPAMLLQLPCHPLQPHSPAWSMHACAAKPFLASPLFLQPTALSSAPCPGPFHSRCRRPANAERRTLCRRSRHQDRTSGTSIYLSRRL